MSPFNKQELWVVSSILLIIVLVSLQNFKVSVMRARDNQRKNDLGTISEGLSRFQNDFGSYPLSSVEGKILACDPLQEKDPQGKPTVRYSPCDWGKDALADELDPKYPAYIKTLPSDPKSQEGVSYLYFSNRSRFQLYAYLEVEKDEEYNIGIVGRGLSCGNRICNFGKSSGDTPLEKSIEEYENELLQKKMNN